MVNNNLYARFLEAKNTGGKKFVVLIDPDKVRLGKISKVLEMSVEAGVDYFFIGGSLVVNDMLDYVLKSMKELCHIPMILKHVITAPFLKVSPLEIIPTGYMLIDGGIMTSVQYMSNTNPIPSNKDDIALCTAMAGEMLGLKQIYMDAGSGAKNPISESMINTVSGGINIPLIVGGGISTPEKAAANAKAGADVIVVGNAIEKDPMLIRDIAQAVHSQATQPKASAFQ